jgi:hypothetical protein
VDLLFALGNYLVPTNAMAARIPPLLEPFLSLPPEATLILLTSVLGASTNWLILRYIQSVLVPVSDVDPGAGTKVILVSFLRDFGFWTEGAKRLVSLFVPDTDRSNNVLYSAEFGIYIDELKLIMSLSGIGSVQTHFTEKVYVCGWIERAVFASVNDYKAEHRGVGNTAGHGIEKHLWRYSSYNKAFSRCNWRENG